MLPYEDRANRVPESLASGDYYFWLGHTYVALERPGEGIACAKRAMEIAEHRHHQMLVAQSSFLLAYACFAAGRPAEGISQGQRAIRVLESLGQQPFWLSAAWQMVGLNHLLAGEFNLGLEALGRAEGIASTFGFSMVTTMSSAFQAVAWSARGDWRRATRQAQRRSEQVSGPAEPLVLAGTCGVAELARGDPAAAISLLESGCRHPFPSLRSTFASHLSEAHLLRGNVNQAAVCAHRAATDCSLHAYSTPRALRIRGRVELTQGAFVEAHHDLTQSLQRFLILGDLFESGRTHLHLAELARASGDNPSATNHLLDAREQFVLTDCREYVERTHAMADSLGLALS